MNLTITFKQFLKEINYHSLTSGIGNIGAGMDERFSVYSLSGIRLLSDVSSTTALSDGIYMINGRKILIRR